MRNMVEVYNRFFQPMPWEADYKPMPEDDTKPSKAIQAFKVALAELEEKHDMRIKADGPNILIIHQETGEEEWL